MPENLVTSRKAAPVDAGNVKDASVACDRALLPHQQMPTAEEVADLAARIGAHGAALAAILSARGPGALTEDAVIALRDWAALSGGPGAGAFGTWIHVRSLARVCRALVGHVQDACAGPFAERTPR